VLIGVRGEIRGNFKQRNGEIAFMMPAMRFFFYLGAVFLIFAFAGAAAESIPRSMVGGIAGAGWFVSAYEVWYAASPGSLVVSQIRVERLSPALWDPLIVGLLALPTWLLFGAPGAAMVWFFRPHEKMTAEQLEDFKKHAESLFLFDELVKEAREGGHREEDDDQAPTLGGYENMEILEPEGGVGPFSEEQVLGDLEFDNPDGSDPDK